MVGTQPYYYIVAGDKNCRIYRQGGSGLYAACTQYELSWISGPKLMNGERPK